MAACVSPPPSSGTESPVLDAPPKGLPPIFPPAKSTSTQQFSTAGKTILQEEIQLPPDFDYCRHKYWLPGGTSDKMVLVGEGNGTPLQHSCLENPMDGGAWWAAVHGVGRSQTRLSDFTFTSHFHALEKEMATHSSVLAWRIPGAGEPGGLPSMGSHRVGHD